MNGEGLAHDMDHLDCKNNKLGAKNLNTEAENAIHK
jgi:hypothetical protein